MIILQFCQVEPDGLRLESVRSDLVISPVDTIRNDKETGAGPPDNSQNSDQEFFLRRHFIVRRKIFVI